MFSQDVKRKLAPSSAPMLKGYSRLMGKDETGTIQTLTTHIQLTATYSQMGRDKEARAEAAEVLRINAKFSVDFCFKRAVMKTQSEKDKTADALRKAGL